MPSEDKAELLDLMQEPRIKELFSRYVKEQIDNLADVRRVVSSTPNYEAVVRGRSEASLMLENLLLFLTEETSEKYLERTLDPKKIDKQFI